MIAALIHVASIGLGLVGSPQAPLENCLKVRSALIADSIPMTENFVTVECPDSQPAPAFHYDSVAGTSRLARSVSQDEVVPLYPEFGLKLVRPGQALRIVIFSGAVRIEREVKALQAARPGHKLFVRSNDGQVLSVRYQDKP